MQQPYGLLLAGMNYSAVAEDEFNEWYDTEHLIERGHPVVGQNAAAYQRRAAPGAEALSPRRLSMH